LGLLLVGLERPKPCGAWPRSVVFPCADQVRVLFPGRFCDTPALVFAEARPLTPAFAEEGRLLETCCWREDAAGLLFDSRPWRTFAPGAFPARPADRLLLLTVCTGMCEAAAAGAVRAITARFCTDEGGVETWARAFAAPVKLALVGENEALLVTRALRNEASERCIELRLTACPFTKLFRVVAVTAFALCA
jgi:hypothetical protein